jgi:transcription initiation factor TFIIIB Brf1 subunit/transcription initiation factor TFIIB
MDGYELICIDNGEVLEQYYIFEDAQALALPSNPPLRVDEGWVARMLRAFDDVAETVASHLNIPQHVVENARRVLVELAREKRAVLATERGARRYSIAVLWHCIRSEGIPVSFREYISVFSREERRRFMKLYREVAGRLGAGNGKDDLFRAFLLKAVSAAGISLPDVLRRAEEIAELLKRRRAIKPNILAMVSLVIAGEEKGLRVPKGRVARALGVVNYHETLKYAKSILSSLPATR